MCIKMILEWFNKPNPVPDSIPDPPPGSTPAVKRTLLSFAINNYPGTANDLQGCLNDQDNIAQKVLSIFPDFTIKKFRDSQVTINCYKTEVAKAISELKPGSTVLILPDSCFSGTVTRFMNSDKHPTQNRYYQNPDLFIRSRAATRIFKGAGNIKWIVISGCGEEQTSADAYINGQYNGAFTWFAVKALKSGITYRQWYKAIRTYLPSKNYDQAPELEGPDELLDKKIFEDDTLIIHNSSHGTQTYDANGDEEDGYDEAIYLYDGMVIDDDINAILQKIP